MKYTPIFAALIMLALLSSSCSRYYYKPTGINAPLFTGGNQGHMNVGGSIGDGDGTGTTSNFDAQLSYSPINYLAVMGNYSAFNYTPDNYDYPNGRVDARAHLLEGGIGGYYFTGGKKVKLVTDLFIGGGSGNINSDVDLKVTRLFLQPGIGIRTPWVDVAFNFRYSRMTYRNLDPKGHDLGYLQNQGLISPYGRTITDGSYNFLEPALTVRAGYKFAKVQFQAVLAQNVSTVYWDYNASRFTVGFYLSVEEIFDMAKANRSRPSNDD